MKWVSLAIGLILAICLLLFIVIPVLQRAATAKEMEHATTVLRDCYIFVFAREIDSRALVTPYTIPKTLNEVPGWTEYVKNTVDPALRPLYLRIDWHPPEDLSEGKEIASIELPHSRAVVLKGGSAYCIKK